MFPRFLSKTDRRRRKRQLFNTSVRVFTRRGCLDGIGINVSDVGMCMFAIANLAVGSEVDVEFLPPGGAHKTRIPALVRHRALYLYGLEFQEREIEIMRREWQPSIRASTARDPAADEPVAVSPSNNRD
jgi:hypothetical protein